MENEKSRLVITVKKDENLLIGSDISISFSKSKGASAVRFAIIAPKSVRIMREARINMTNSDEGNGNGE